jgi:2-aminoadipate transaminase
VREHARDRTVTIGSASKMIAPGLRVGWLGAPRWLTPTLTLVKQTLDLHTATLNQLVVADILRDRAFLAAHLDGVRARTETRATTLQAALAGCVTTAPVRGGMFCWGITRVDTRAAFGRAVAAGVAYVPGDAFTVARDGSHALRLSFATLAPADLVEAAGRLRAVLAVA